MPAAAPVSASPAPPCVCGRLRRAARALTQLYDDLMAPSGLRVTQFSLLRTLAARGPLRMSDLAAATLVDRTALSRNLAPLASLRLVRIAAGADARTREISLTRAGHAALARAVPHWEEAQACVARRLGARKSSALIDLLHEVEALHPAPGAHAK